jgi:diadenosine tetraphosphate (Ap4A) HIT family hydrolase
LQYEDDFGSYLPEAIQAAGNKKGVKLVDHDRMISDLAAQECPHCLRIKQADAGTLDTLVHQTPRSIVIAGDHQFFPGYCVVIARKHIREMHDMPGTDASELFGDVLKVGSLIAAGFKSFKMNYASLGNVHEHLHWHVIPRQHDEPDFRDHPWKNSQIFSKYPTTYEAITTMRRLFSES